MATINYTPPPAVREFIKHYLPGRLFYNWIIGPVGSGKTTGILFKIAYMAKLQEPSPVDGIRRTRVVVVRNTMPQLKDTTLVSWNYWFKDGQAGKWLSSDSKFIMRFDDVECEVLFRPLDTPDDIARVLSLEVTFAVLDEFVQIPREIVDALSSRVGRYPSKKDGGATNWGIWGSSNPGNEDDWWFEYLYGNEAAGVKACTPMTDTATAVDGKLAGTLLENHFYFEQPSGFSDKAENLENLPGGRGYYTNQAEGKPKNWVRQFIEVRWGYSVVGDPVLKSFNPDIHVAKQSIRKFVNPAHPLIIGFDPGMKAAAIVGQQDLSGRLLVLAEICTDGMGAVRFAREKLLPFLRAEFPRLPFIIVPDPAANSRTPTDERTVVQVFKAAPFNFTVDIVDANNTLERRIQAGEHFTTRLVDGHPALLIDPSCKRLIRALAGGWRFTVVKKGEGRSAEPEKNIWSHPADAFCYLSRYYHKGVLKEARRAGKPFTPPRFANTYALQ